MDAAMDKDEAPLEDVRYSLLVRIGKLESRIEQIGVSDQKWSLSNVFSSVALLVSLAVGALTLYDYAFVQPVEELANETQALRSDLDELSRLASEIQRIPTEVGPLVARERIEAYTPSLKGLIADIVRKREDKAKVLGPADYSLLSNIYEI